MTSIAANNKAQCFIRKQVHYIFCGTKKSFYEFKKIAVMIFRDLFTWAMLYSQASV